VVCSVGCNAAEFTKAIQRGDVGIRRTQLPGSARIWTAAEIVAPVADPAPVWPGLDLTGHERLAIVAAREALESAGLAVDDVRERIVGVYVGACQGGFTSSDAPAGSAEESFEIVRQGLNSLADTLAVALEASGPRVVTSNACSASASAIAVAVEELVAGRIDVAVVGGADALQRYTLEGFGSLASLDARSCSPYHRSSGLVVGEGAGFLVLETSASASERGRTHLRGRLLGWGASADAYHPTTPDPTGRGARLAIERALAMAGCGPADVDHVNGHGTGTLANDTMELRAFSGVFGDCSPAPSLSSTKSMIGHTLGAATAIESIAILVGMSEGFVAPTMSDGASRLMPSGCAPLDVVTDIALTQKVERSIKTSYAFGGANYALLWGAASGEPPVDVRPHSTPVVTGIGVLGPAGSSLAEWGRVLDSGRSVLKHVDAGTTSGEQRSVLIGRCPDLPGRGPTTPNAWRRMDRQSRRCVVTARAALEDAGLGNHSDDHDALMVLLATASGPMSTLLEFRAQLRKDANERSLAALFPNAALNAAGGHVASSMGLRGGIASFTSGALTGDAALRHAADLIMHGRQERVLVVAAEELTRDFIELVVKSEAIPLAGTTVVPFDTDDSGTALAETVVCFVLEAEDVARRRGARLHGRYLGSGLRTSRSIPTADGWRAAFDEALATSNSGREAVRAVYAAASGFGDRDQAEREALRTSFGESTRVIPIKEVMGDSLGASGCVAAAAAMLGFASSAPAVGVNNDSVALVNSVSWTGQCWTTAWGAPPEKAGL
jgi:3-oxoacyl-[acyl-carrier-protein] synthase II